MPINIPEKVTLNNGVACLKGLIADAPAGTYEIKFECKNVSLKTASLVLTITSGPAIGVVRYTVHNWPFYLVYLLFI